MILITGGAYQGKLEYAEKTYGLSEADVFTCSPDKAEIDLSKKIINQVDKYVLACVKTGLDPEEEVARLMPEFKDKIITCTDISQGVVPIDKTERAWREGTGRFMTVLGREADCVVRMFCGIPEKVK